MAKKFLLSEGLINTKDQQLEEIAKHFLEIETLQTRKSDELDFHEVSVWSLKQALEAAYEAGKQNVE